MQRQPHGKEEVEEEEEEEEEEAAAEALGKQVPTEFERTRSNGKNK
jgi:hypothetical protein